MEREQHLAEASSAKTGGTPTLRYERPFRPLHFPESELVPESSVHLEVRTALYLVLKANFAAKATIGCDQFVYWDPTRPSESLAPDAFLRFGAPHAPFRSWKVWERGAPEVAVEILSTSDERDRDFEGKLAKYARLGVRELVTFDPEESAGLRLFTFLDGDCVERVLESRQAGWSEVLGLWWVVVEDATIGSMLRLSRNQEGTDLLLTPEETERRAGEQRIAERDQRIAERDQRIAELEAKLAIKGRDR